MHVFVLQSLDVSDSCQIQQPEIQAQPDLQNLDAIYAMPFSKLDFSDVNCKVPSHSDHSDWPCDGIISWPPGPLEVVQR